MDAANGAILWSHASLDIWGAAVITTNGVVLVSTQKTLFAFGAANGTRLWSKVGKKGFGAWDEIQ